MTESRKRVLYIGGGVLVLFLLYRWYTAHAQAAQSTSSQTGSTDPAAASAQYAGLAGQEQSDVAALQSQNQQLLAQEQSDVQNLQAGLAGITSDLGALAIPTQDQINSWIAAAVGAQAPPQAVASVGAGGKSTTTKPGLIGTVKGVGKNAYNAIFNEGFQEGWNSTHGRPASYHVQHAQSAGKYGVTSKVWDQVFNTGYKAGRK